MAAIFTAASCSSDYEDISDYDGTKQVSFICSGDFSIESVTEMTRAINTTVSDIWVFDYMDGKLVQEIHQKTGDMDFGRPTLNLKYGRHNLYFVISDGDCPTVDNANFIIKWVKPGDTFHSSMTVDVTSISNNNFTVDMKRIVAKLAVRINDGLPLNANTFEMIASKWFNSINYITANAVNQKQFTYSLEIPSIYKGNTNSIVYEFYTLLNGNSFTTNPYINVYGENGKTIATASLGNVEMVRGKLCTYTGSFVFTDGSDGIAQISFNLPEWGHGTNGTW